MPGNVYLFIILLAACALLTGCTSSTPPEPQPPAQNPDAAGPESTPRPKPPTVEELTAAQRNPNPGACAGDREQGAEEQERSGETQQ